MPATLFAACIQRLGLSQPEAARLFDWRLDTVKSWASGRNRVPAGIWTELRAYEARIAERSEALHDALEEGAAKAGGPPQAIDAVVDDEIGLMALADFVLNTDVPIGEVQVGIVKSA